MHTAKSHWILSLAITSLICGSLQPSSAEEPPQVIRFNRDIRPILSNNCFLCHGPDKGRRKSDLRLDIEAEAKKEVIVPGKLEDSELWTRITSSDGDERMPPEKSKKYLTPKQISLIKKWIEQGAKYEGHWAFIPPTSPAPPQNKTQWAVIQLIYLS